MSQGELPPEAAKHIHVPTYNEILERVGKRITVKRKGNRLNRELSRLQALRDIVISKTDFIRDLVRLLDSLHPFYWSLIEIEFDRDELRKAIKCISKARKMTDRLAEKYRILLLASENPRELNSVAREARGRILSLYKRCSRGLVLLRSLVTFIQKLPGIETSNPTIIVAGPPSSGKSTFVSSVSRARPKIAEYPFTTKEIHVGHFTLGSIKVQVVDTPGLLDRDIEEMNQVERKAAAALSKLPGVILYLFDASSNAYMSLERQENLLVNTVAKLVYQRKIYVAVNKADIAEPEKLKVAIKIAERAAERVRGEIVGPMVAASRDDALRVAELIARKEFLR